MTTTAGKADGNREPVKVGFFDSGIGGRSVLDAFRRLCPGVETEYLADSENCPYGNRTREEIIRLSENCTARLLERGCRVVVVACNTATAQAIESLRKNHPDIPFVGMEPALKPAAVRSKTKKVAVLATRGTFSGRHFNETKERYASGVSVITAVADEFVELVERGETAGAAAEAAVRAKITPLLDAGCDQIVLGCTHFPHLKALIESVCGDRAEVVDPSDAVARQIERVIGRLS